MNDLTLLMQANEGDRQLKLKQHMFEHVLTRVIDSRWQEEQEGENESFSAKKSIGFPGRSIYDRDIEQHTGIELCYAGYAIIARAIDTRGASLSADFLTVHRTVYGEDYGFATDWSANAEVFDQGEAGEKWKVSNPRVITPSAQEVATPIAPRFSRPRG